MKELFSKAKKAFTTALVAIMAISSVGSALLAPMAARAAVASGSLVKGSLSAVYYVGSDNKRYVFPNEKTYKTWYSDFSTVQTITDAELASLPIGGNVTYRPGVKLVKIVSDPKVYAVAAHGVLRWVTTESIAIALYGSNWNTKVDDVSDAFFVNYTIGADITAASQFNPANETAAAASINVDKGLTGTVGGNLSASLNAGTPASTTLPGGATRVTFLKFDVRNNGSTATTLDSVTAHRFGAGEADDFDSVYLFEGENRLTTGRTVNTTSNEANFTSLNITLAAGQTRTFSVVADMDDTNGDFAGNVNAFEITKVMSGAVQASGLPVAGNSMTLSSTTTGTLQVDKSGSLSNPKVGQLAAKVAEFRVTGPSNEDMDLRGITLFNGGSMSASDVNNFVLKNNGNTIATASSIDGEDHVVFTIGAPMLIERGNQRTFEVFADISASARTNDTLQLYVEETSDVYGVGKTLGVGVKVDNGDFDASDTSCTSDSTCSDSSFVTIEGGQITLTFNGPVGNDVATDANDVELFNFTLATQSDIEIRNWDFVVEGLASNGTTLTDFNDFVTDFKLSEVSTGATITNSVDVTDAGDNGTENVTFTDSYSMTGGTSKQFKITADLGSDIPAGVVSIRVTLDTFDANDIRNLDNSTFISTSDIVPSSDIIGNKMTLEDATLVASAASTPIAQTYIQGTQNAPMYGLSLKAGDASDVKVTSITIRTDVDGDDAGASFQQGQDDDTDGGLTDKASTDILLAAKLMNGNVQLGDTESPTTSSGDATGGLLEFNNFQLTIPKGQTVTLNLFGNLSSSITGLSDVIRFRVIGSSDISAQDLDGNTVAPSGTASGNSMTISTAGTVTVALAADDAESENGIVVGGASNVVLGKFRFTAANEDLKLTKQRITLVNTAAASAVSSLSLYDGSTLVAGPVAINGANADFSGFTFSIPKDSSKTLTVKANLNSVGGQSGAKSGADLKVRLEVDTEFEVRGTSAGSNTLITDGGTDKDANSKIIRKTKPTVTMVALPTTVLANGTQVLSKFTISADAAEQVSLKKLSFRINGSDADADLAITAPTSDSSLRVIGESSNLAGITVVPTTGGSQCDEGAAACVIEVAFATASSATGGEVNIAAGSSKTFELRLNVAGVEVSGDSVSTQITADATNDALQVTGGLVATLATYVDLSIDDFDNLASIGTGGADNDAEPLFIWSDNSAVPHTDQADTAADDDEDDDNDSATAESTDWTNGRFIKIVPSDFQSMSRP